MISGSALNVTKIGSGMQTLSGSNTYGKTTTVSAGTLVAGSAYAFASGPLDVAAAGTALLAPSLGTAMKMPALSIAAGGKLDLSNNQLVTASPVGSWDGSAYTAVTGLIQSGRATGNWSGSGIITSRTDATTSSLTTLGIATAAQATGIEATATTVWAGQTVSGSDTLVMYTYGGDANLDGKINVDDYGRIDFNAPLGTSGWINGDFNYDGKINVDDYGIIDFNVGIQGPPFFTGSGIGDGLNVLVVPEPVGLGIAWGAAAILNRRRRARETTPDVN